MRTEEKSRHTFRTRFYELDFHRHVNNAVYADYLIEVFFDRLESLGIGIHFCEMNQAYWQVKRLEIRYYYQVGYAEDIVIESKISCPNQSGLVCEFDVFRAVDKLRVVRARFNAHLQTKKHRKPFEIPDKFFLNLPLQKQSDDLDIRMRKFRDTSDAFRYCTHRSVQIYELDAFGYVGTGYYLRWIVQAYFNAIRECGHTIETWAGIDRLVVQGGHDLEIFERAQDNDEIEIVSWICEMAKVRGAWTHEIFNTKTGKLIARDYSLGIFVTQSGKPASLPEQLVEDALRGGLK